MENQFESNMRLGYWKWYRWNRWNRWNQRNRLYLTNFQRRICIHLYIFIEHIKRNALVHDILTKYEQLHQKLIETAQPIYIDVPAISRYAYLRRIGVAILSILIVQFFLTLQFHVYANLHINIVKWICHTFSDVINSINFGYIMLSMICFGAYGSLIGAFYVHPLPLYDTRFDYFVFAGLRKILRFAAQMIIILWSLYCLKDFLYSADNDNEPNATYVYLTVFFVGIRNFCTQTLIETDILEFPIIPLATYEKIHFPESLWLHSAFREKFRYRILTPFRKFTIVYYAIINIMSQTLEFRNNGFFGGLHNFGIIFPDIYVLFCTYLLLAHTNHIIEIMDSLVRTLLTEPIEFSLTDKPSNRPLLFKALQFGKRDPWIFQIAARDFHSLSRDNVRYRAFYIDSEHYWLDISDLSLDLIKTMTKSIKTSYETPDKLTKTKFIEKALNDNNVQHIFKRFYDRDGFIWSLTRPPILCSCPLGPLPLEKPILSGRWLRYFQRHTNIAYELFEKLKFQHFWHYFCCPTYGCRIRHQLRDTATIEALICGLVNVCVAASKDNQLQIMRTSLSPIIMALIDLIQTLEVVPYNRYELYGLDAVSHTNLRSLESHAKRSLYKLLECYKDRLLIFVNYDLIEDINKLILANKWPIKQ